MVSRKTADFAIFSARQQPSAFNNTSASDAQLLYIRMLARSVTTSATYKNAGCKLRTQLELEIYVTRRDVEQERGGHSFRATKFAFRRAVSAINAHNRSTRSRDTVTCGLWCSMQFGHSVQVMLSNYGRGISGATEEDIDSSARRWQLLQSERELSFQPPLCSPRSPKIMPLEYGRGPLSWRKVKYFTNLTGGADGTRTRGGRLQISHFNENCVSAHAAMPQDPSRRADTP